MIAAQRSGRGERDAGSLAGFAITASSITVALAAEPSSCPVEGWCSIASWPTVVSA
ncbi:Hypothetical protein A7982_02381 [Minicystis rosea]|nr:Hypothetical protein A7982_02381 [Minicystis rosea]